ncbi:hypothetical protein Tco_0545397 [Tanacetum coccineum]
MAVELDEEGYHVGFRDQAVARAMWFEEAEEAFLHNVRVDKETAEALINIIAFTHVKILRHERQYWRAHSTRTFSEGVERDGNNNVTEQIEKLEDLIDGDA